MIPGNTLSLQITQQFGRIGINFTKPVQEIRQPAPRVEIQQPPAQMHQGPGELRIDGSAAHAALGHSTTEAMNFSVYQQARSRVLEIIGEIAAEGSQLASIEKGVTIADIALQRWNSRPNSIQYVGMAARQSSDRAA